MYEDERKVGDSLVVRNKLYIVTDVNNSGIYAVSIDGDIFMSSGYIKPKMSWYDNLISIKSIF